MLPSYIKDRKHSIHIFDKICFSGFQKLIFTICLKSLYTVIPYPNGVEALKCFLNKRTLSEPSTTTLIRLEKLLLILNKFSFHRKHYQQISRVAIGTNMGPSHANDLLVMLNNKYSNKTLHPYLIVLAFTIHYCLGTGSCTRVDLGRLVNYVNGFYPALTFTWEISETCVLLYIFRYRSMVRR